MAAPAAITTPAACASCIFGAASTSLLSFSYHAIETITVSVIPHITVFQDGRSPSTSYESITQTQTDIVGSGSGSNASKTYTNADDITWTVGDATLTYPTTYVQYLGFSGAPLTSTGSEACAKPTASPVALPASTDAASFIYALAANASSMLLPTPLLEYLGDLGPISSQFHGEALTGCSPLDYVPPTAAASSSKISSTSSTSTRRFEGPRTNSSSSGTRITPAPYTSLNGTVTSSTSTSIVSSSEESSLFSSSVSNTQGPAQTPPASASTPVAGGGASSSVPAPASSEVPTATTAAPSSAHSGTSEVTEPAVATSANDHTTAFVIQPITGKPIVTTQSAPQGENKPTSGNGSPGGYTTGGSGAAPQHTTQPNNGGGQQTQGGGGSSADTPQAPDIGGLVSNIGQAATQTPGSSGQGSGSSGSGSSDSGSSGSGNGGSGSSGQSGNSGSGSNSGQNSGSGSGGSGQGSANGQTSQQQGSDGSSPPVYSGNGNVITAASGGAVVYGSQTVSPGQSVTIGQGSSATVIALQTNGGSTNLVVGGSTYKAGSGNAAVTSAPGLQGAAGSAVITTNGHTITAVQSGGSLVLQEGSSKVTVPAGSAVTFEGQTVSAARVGGSVGVNGNAAPLFVASAASEAVVTASGHTFTAVDSGSSVVLADGSSTVTIKDGSQTLFDGQTVTVRPSGAVIVGGRTMSMSAAAAAAATDAVITTNGHTITAIDKSSAVVLVDGSSTVTVRDGSTVTFEGQTFSAKASGTAVVINGKTIQLSSDASSTPASTKSTSTTSTGLGGYITSGLSGGSSASPNAANASSNSASGVGMSLVCVLAGVLGVLAML